MENTTPNDPQQINQQFNNQFGQVALPNAAGALVLGIISTVFGLIWCYWIGSFIGLICGIISINMANGGKKLTNQFPNKYLQSSVGNNNAGKILGIVGVCLSSLGILGLIILLAVVGSISSYVNGSPFH